MNNEEAQARLDKITSGQQAESDLSDEEKTFLCGVEEKGKHYRNSNLPDLSMMNFLGLRDMLMECVDHSMVDLKKRLTALEERKPQKHVCDCMRGGTWIRKGFSLETFFKQTEEEQNNCTYGERLIVLDFFVANLQEAVKKLRTELTELKQALGG